MWLATLTDLWHEQQHVSMLTLAFRETAFTIQAQMVLYKTAISQLPPRFIDFWVPRKAIIAETWSV